MSDRDIDPAPNPFSTRFVRPGAISYLFDAGESAENLVHRLADFGWRAEIVGPHGSGKSTLVAGLLAVLEEAGRPARLISLRDGQRRMPLNWVSQALAAPAGTIVVDGYEQLSYLNRWRLKARCRRHGWGLLVTAHQHVGFPTLARLDPKLPVAQAVVDRLLPSGNGKISRETVAECFAAAGGDIRETLFSLYDRYEGRSPGKAGG